MKCELPVVTNTAKPPGAIPGWWKQILVKQSWSFFIALCCFVGWALCSYYGVQKSSSLDRAGKLSTIIRSADGNLQEDESVEGDDDSTGRLREGIHDF